MEYQELLKKAFEKMPKKVDAKDRFVVPKMVLEISGSKTIVKNFGEILSVLRRDASHFSKFIFKESATAGSVHGSELVLQGKVSRELLQKKLEDYIKEFVYCKECGEPDTKLVKEDRLSFLKCEACGAKHSVRSI